MITAVRTGENIPYVLIRDRDSEDPTVFKLRSLSEAEDRYLRGIVMKGQPVKGKNNKNKDEKLVEFTNVAMRDALHIGLTGGENFKYSDKVEAKWERDKKAMSVFGSIKPWTENTIKQIRPADRVELATEIMGLSEYVVKEKRGLEKNS